jgi:hypothetical protein
LVSTWVPKRFEVLLVNIFVVIVPHRS